MLLYLADIQLTQATETLLEHVETNTPLLLVQNAVYLYERISADYPQLAVTLLEEDAIVRGVSIDHKVTWSMAEWTSKGALLSPWVKL